MQTKLTLWLDHDLIEQAYMIACQQNKSLTSEETDAAAEGLPPITQSLCGVLAGCTVEDGDYQRRLEEKHL